MKKIFLTLSLILIGFSYGLTQTQKAFEEAAKTAFSEKDYYSALVYYQNLLEFDTTKLDVRYYLAESAKNFSAYKVAEENYQYVVDQQSDNDYPDATFNLGFVKQMQGKYEEAKEIYNLYLMENSGENPLLTSKADMQREACEWAIEQIANPDESMKLDKMGEGFNTIYSDFAPAILGDTLLFSSMRFDKTTRGVEKISKVLLSENEENPSLYENPINETDLNVANTAYNTDGTKIFYTICERLNDSELRCDLYCRMINPDGTFGEAKKLPDFINNPEYTNTQPTVGYDPNTEKEILYFVSDREGGKGQLDLWYSIIDNKDNFTAPQNLAELNTLGNEITPFYHKTSNQLFFSSDGYRSFGGYDVYQSKWTPDGYTEARHLNNPLNTSYHDIYYVLSDDGETAYFATNREGAQYIDQDQEACCFDLFKVEYLPLDLDLNAMTFDLFSKDSLKGATVSLLDEDTGEIIELITSDNSAEHLFRLDRCRNYVVIATKAGYEPDSLKLSSCEYKKSQVILKKFYLEPKDLNLEVLTFESASKEALNGCTVTVYDLTDPDIAPQIMTDNGKNQFIFELQRGHKYRVEATKFGFELAETEFETSDIPGTSVTKKLYLGKDFQARLTAYLPLSLYFDNDKPDPRTVKRSSKSTYSQSYNKYIAKQDYFTSRSKNPTNMTDFFESTVKGNYAKLNIFLSQLEKALIAGESYELSIRGFTSPLAVTEYNLILGQRRVSTIRNEVAAYQSGALLKYIENGQLKVTDISFGETLAPKDVSDSANEISASIFSVDASLERRVEIIDVTQQ